MNAPALAPVQAAPAPGPSNGNATPSRDAEPGAFARELQAAAQPAPPSGSPKSPPAPEATRGARGTADAGSSAAPDADANDAPDGTADATGEGESADTAGAQAAGNRARSTLERWLAGVRGARDDRGASAPQVQPGSPEAAEASASAVAAETDRTRRRADAPEGTAAVPDAGTLALLQRQADGAQTVEDGSERNIDAGTLALLQRQAEATTEAATEAGDAADPAADRGGIGAVASAAAAAARRAQAGQAADRGDAAGARAPVVGTGDDGVADAASRAALPLVARDDTAFAAAAPAPALATLPPLPGAFAAELNRAGQVVATVPAAAPAEVHVATPVTAPEFVPRLSGELAVLARDGVQEARVQVNPGELGPIAVQITLDGNAAQVRLAVDSAVTRDLLEQAMPSLAAALRENGLTLTGGGVFQQPRGQGREAQPGEGGSARTGEAARDGGIDALAPAATVRRVRHPGQLDVFA